ncbi:MAG: delta-lactam-biosynthetic de-N-acetylase, partial [Clostridia bacterium]|nr:delta-lactam-biosynthetic de-N-acetylase [Clostridia bacterium]
MIIKLNKKHLVIISLCALVVVTTIIGSLLKSDTAVAVSSEITNWGLSFKEEGKAPMGNLSQTELSKYDAA